MSRRKLMFHAVILCTLCSTPFTSRDSRQKYCLACVHKPCENCGGVKKNPRARMCKPCSLERDRERLKIPTKRIIPLPAIPCSLCSTLFVPRNTQQHHCSICVHKPCEVCGGPKDPRGPFCKKCDSINRIGRPCEWSRREEKSIKQVTTEVEAFGLLPEKRYAFGYVIGVMFGDGSISKVTDRVKSTRTDGSVRVFPQISYRPTLSVTSHAFVERFITQWEILTGRSVKMWSYLRTDFSKSTLKGKPDEYSVKIFIVNPRHKLLGRYLAYLKYESDPSILLKFPLDVMRGFIHGMIDSEGYLNPKFPERIDIANKDIKLLDTLVLMLNALEFGGTVYTYPSQNVSHLVTSMPYTKYGHDM